MGNVKKHCVTCKYEDKNRKIEDGLGGIETWCKYRSEWKNINERQSGRCSDWSFIHGEENTSSLYSESNSFEKNSTSNKREYNDFNSFEKFLFVIGAISAIVIISCVIIFIILIINNGNESDYFNTIITGVIFYIITIIIQVRLR